MEALHRLITSSTYTPFLRNVYIVFGPGLYRIRERGLHKAHLGHNDLLTGLNPINDAQWHKMSNWPPLADFTAKRPVFLPFFYCRLDEEARGTYGAKLLAKSEEWADMNPAIVRLL